MGYLLAHWDAAARVIGVAPAARRAAARPPRPRRARRAAGTRVHRDRGRPGRRARADRDRPRDRPPGRRARGAVGQVDTQSRAAVGNADRAEGLLVAFAARRALDRGVALGFLEALLRQRFGDSQPQAVGMIITAAREPVTLQELQDGLLQVRPAADRRRRPSRTGGARFAPSSAV